MKSPKPVWQRQWRLRLVVAWVVGTVGVTATIISISPSLSLTFSFFGNSSYGVFHLTTFTIAAVELAIPIFIALAIANARRRWWLWLGSTVILVLLLLLLRPAFGSLNVFWLG
ncbi:hypothetical protein FB555_000504 [Alpinimonas psychrophila]|uniref:Uncharacterized protein n=1 Tax=Alpinimonas psychrophila TaxID=748908 RepID=A0A7W3JSG9_9MICO|nr:hypothetical protein [Alpinimonas psychrophila]